MSYTCPRCGATSYDPNDIRYKYCGRCHRFEDALYAFTLAYLDGMADNAAGTADDDECREYPTGSHCTHWQFGTGACCSCGARPMAEA